MKDQGHVTTNAVGETKVGDLPCAFRRAFWARSARTKNFRRVKSLGSATPISRPITTPSTLEFEAFQILRAGRFGGCG